MSDTAARLVRLLSLLQSPREWPGSELAARLGVSPRTVRRDVERLRDLGYPVRATMGAIGGYRLVAGTAMPPLLLDDEEAVAVAVGLRSAAGGAVEGVEEASVRALAKLEQVLPSRLRRRVGALAAATVSLTVPGGAAVAPEHLTTLAAAAVAHERVRFRYRAADGRTSRRLVEPHRLVAAGRRWYLLAYDTERHDWRVFRVDRLTDPRATGVRVPPREPPGGDAAAHVRDKIYALAPAYRLRATLALPAAEAARRSGLHPDTFEPVDAHSCRMDTDAEALEWIASRLLMLGCDFTVHEPPELRTYLAALATRAHHAATTRPTEGPDT
ncbi:helix-turn-helix transcriptional regulator [Streptomyces avicenniae]|uniref:helix-turn-helix transcriptional regulator n=1 Tax=Streptomyces avicenniae TaxID=500153 RepID=UPI000699DC41|nr:YafY family protein [Streptomyces avicenniae]